MGKIIYTQDDYETISRNIGKVINQVENNIKVHRQLIDVLSAQDAKVYKEHVEKLENVDKEISEYLTEIKLFQEHLDAFIEEAEEELEPNSMICPVEIDIPVVKKNIMELIANVDESLSSINLEPTSHFYNWERKTENELNNSFLDALVHYKNEREQKMYEEQFRSNQRIMNNVMDDLIDDLSFTDEFEDLEEYIEKITGFEDIFEIHKSNFDSLDLQKKIENTSKMINNPQKELTKIETEKLMMLLSNNIDNLDVSDETKDYLMNLGTSLINNESYDKIVGEIIEASNKTNEELIEKIVLSNGSIRLERILKGVGPFGFVDIVYGTIHVIQGNFTEVAGDIGGFLGGLIGDVIGFFGGGPVTAWAVGAAGSLKGEEMFESGFTYIREDIKSGASHIYNDMKLESEEAIRDWKIDIKQYEKLKKDYLKNNDITKLNEYNERLLKIYERDDYCGKIKN